MAQSQANISGFKTFQATAVALAAFVRVSVDSAGLVSVAGATDDWIGITQEPCAASAYVTVRLRNTSGTYLVTASAAITNGAKLYATASGLVDDATGTSNFIGMVALQSATASGDIIEAAPISNLAYTSGAAQAAVITTSATNTTPYGYATQAQADALVTLVNALRTALVNASIIKGS